MNLYLAGISPLPIGGLLAMLCTALVVVATVVSLICFRRRTVAERLLALSMITGIAAAVQAVLALVLMGR